jgi:hypothetical protein
MSPVTPPVAPLADWLRWIAEMPAPFRAAPSAHGGPTHVRAVVADLFETLFGAAPAPALLGACAPGAGPVPGEQRRLGWMLAACHALWHPSLRGGGADRAGVERLLVQEMAAMAAVAPVDALDRDEERREELARRVVRAAGRSFPGEAAREAEDRLRQVDGVERHRVLVAAAQRERRAREVRDAMARKAAEEAAAKVSRE